MEFTYDLSQTPIIGRRHTASSGHEGRPKDPFINETDLNSKNPLSGGINKEEKTTGGTSSPRRSVSLSSADSSSISCWKRPWLSQVLDFYLYSCFSPF